jgi:hypothetical protein
MISIFRKIREFWSSLFTVNVKIEEDFSVIKIYLANYGEQIQSLREELQEAVKTIDKRNSELIGLLTKYFESEKIKVEREVARQEENKPTEDDKRF